MIAVCPGSVATPFFAGRETRTPVEKMLHAENVADTIVATLKLPRNATVSELDIRPANP